MMVNALPLPYGSLESIPHATGQAGGAGPGQGKTAENSSHNSFAKIFGDQAAAASFLNGGFTVVSGNHGGRESNHDWLFGIQDQSGDTLPSMYLASLLENNEHRVSEEADGKWVPGDGAVVGLSSNPSRVEGINVYSAGGDVESQKALFGLSSRNESQDGLASNAVVAPVGFHQGKSGGEIRQPAVFGIQAGLTLFAGTSSSQTAVVGSTPVDQSATHLVTQVDLERVLQNSLAAVAGKTVIESDATGPRLLQHPPSPTGPPQESFRLANTSVNQAFPVPEPFGDTPASIADAAQLSQNRVKSASGVSSVLSESPANGRESSIGIPRDLLADANVALSGDRSRDGLETTGKVAGMDPNVGQGLNHGMGHPTHSQSGFQQSSSSSTPGPTVRMAEERAPDLPGPALQRLQMEVHLSETNRVQIDVGVQHRQVYASLLMDQATLKNLAVQFVPQLEEQLTQSEMELQDFFAEVRDHQSGQESDTRSDGAGTQTKHPSTTSLPQATGSLSHMGRRAEEQGFHLVA